MRIEYNLVSHTQMEYLSFWGSDHRPVITHINTRRMVGTKKFHFDKRWMSKLNFDKIVQEGWLKSQNGQPLTSLGDRIGNCWTIISRWQKHDQQNLNRGDWRSEIMTRRSPKPWFFLCGGDHEPTRAITIDVGRWGNLFTTEEPRALVSSWRSNYQFFPRNNKATVGA